MIIVFIFHFRSADSNVIPSDKTYTCNQCEYHNSSLPVVKRHVIRRHKYLHLYRCKLCSMLLYDMFSVEKHCNRLHEQKIDDIIEDLLEKYEKDFQVVKAYQTSYVCYIPAKESAKKAASPPEKSFSKEYTYMCIICNSTFKMNYHCTRHILYQHCGKDSYGCSLCNYSARYAQMVESHYKVEHPNKVPKVKENTVQHYSFIMKNRK